MQYSRLLVLFVSTGNTARSQIAQALLNGKESGLYRAWSAGTRPEASLNPETKLLLEIAGYETSKLYPKKWQEFYEAKSLVPVDVIVTLSEDAREEMAAAHWPEETLLVHWSLDNPLGAESADIREWKFKKCMATLEARISTFVRMRKPASRSELLLNLKALGMVV